MTDISVGTIVGYVVLGLLLLFVVVALVRAVRIDGEVWTARPYDEDETYEPGQRVSVLQIRGATALVSE